MITSQNTYSAVVKNEVLEVQINEGILNELVTDAEVPPRKKFKATRITAPSPEKVVSLKEEFITIDEVKDDMPPCKTFKRIAAPGPEISKPLNVTIDFTTFTGQMRPRKPWCKYARVTSQTIQQMNSGLTQPLKLSYLNFKSKVKEIFNGTDPGVESWNVDLKQGNFPKVFSLTNTVYICENGANVLKHLDSDKIYIISGIQVAVGNKSHADQQMGLLKNKLVKSGVYTARLPIDEHFKFTKDKMNIFSPEEMFSILVKFNEKGCWKVAVEESVNVKSKGLVTVHCESSCECSMI